MLRCETVLVWSMKEIFMVVGKNRDSRTFAAGQNSAPKDGRQILFLAGQSQVPTGWLALLLTKVEVVVPNPNRLYKNIYIYRNDTG